MAGDLRLFEQAKNKTLKSAYLITCLKQSVLEHMAEKLLLTIYCETGAACGECTACKKILSNSAVDVHIIRPENGIIKVGQIRELKGFLYEKPFESKQKTVLIFEGDKMNAAAQNALLKPLEEPPEDTVFFIFSQSDYGLLPTVISRCENVRLMPDKATAQDTGHVEMRKTPSRAEVALKLSGGYFDEAERLAQDNAYFDLREKTLLTIRKLLDQKTYAVSQAVEFYENNKDRVNDILDIQKFFLMDILKMQYKNDSYIINIDYQSDIAAYAEFFTTGAIYNMIDRLLTYEQRLNYNVNFKLTIESMLFDILKEKYKWLKS